MHDITREFLQRRLDCELNNLEVVERHITSLNNQLKELHEKAKESKEIIKALEKDLNDNDRISIEIDGDKLARTVTKSMNNATRRMINKMRDL